MSVAPACLLPAAPSAPAAAPHPSSFHTLLSELNPLQYLPVIGTVYRAVTGDTIPDSARTIGSLVVSFLLGGPVGVAMSVGAIAAETMTGIDPDAIGQRLLAEIGIGHQPPQAATASAAHATPGGSATQPAALGVTIASIAPRQGRLSGADVLNDIELARLHHPRTDVTA